MATIQEQKFGVEIEVAGAARHRVAQAVAEAIGGTVTTTYRPGFDATVVADPQGREWTIKNDSSIDIVNGHRGSEVVTPVLTYVDIPLLQEVVRKVRSCGASAHRSCAVHIHIDTGPHSPESLSRLAKMVYKNEDLIFDALQVQSDRRYRYTRPMETDFIDKVARRRPRSDRRLNEYWYGRYTPHPEHYHSSRYYVSSNIMWRGMKVF